MSKIVGNYILKASLHSFTDSFTFQNAGQSKVLTLTDDEKLLFFCINAPKAFNAQIHFKSDNILRIKRIRVTTTGAAGLRVGKGNNALNLRMKAITDPNDLTSSIGEFSLTASTFNEWNPTNVEFKAVQDGTEFYLALNHSFSNLCLEDFNVQDEYIGLTFVPFIEMEVDTAGIVDNAGDIV